MTSDLFSLSNAFPISQIRANPIPSWLMENLGVENTVRTSGHAEKFVFRVPGVYEISISALNEINPSAFVKNFRGNERWISELKGLLCEKFSVCCTLCVINIYIHTRRRGTRELNFTRRFSKQFGVNFSLAKSSKSRDASSRQKALRFPQTKIRSTGE